MKHTPGPWEIDPRASTRVRDSADTTIAAVGMASRSLEDAQANARFIVTACNAHDELLEALKESRTYVARAYECAFPDEQRNTEVLEQIDAAIAKAEGK